MNPSDIAQLGLKAWDEYGKYTNPDTAPQDRVGRTGLYIAGFIAGYNTVDTELLHAELERLRVIEAAARMVVESPYPPGIIRGLASLERALATTPHVQEVKE